MVHRVTPKYNSNSIKNTITNNWDKILGVFFLIVVIVILVLAILSFTKSGFANIDFNNLINKSNDNIKDLDVMIFINPKCPWCIKTIDLFKRSGKLEDVQIIDTTTEEGEKLAIMYGATQGLPTFISKKLRTGIFGYKDSVADIVKHLSEIPSPKEQEAAAENMVKDHSDLNNDNKDKDIMSKVKDLDVVLFYNNSCGFCKKAKEDIANLGLENVITFKDVTTTEGKQALRDFNIQANGVPIFASKKTNKHFVGYKPPMSSIIYELE